MIFQLFIAICLGSFLSFFFNELSYLSTVSHNFCLSLAPLSNYQLLNQAIVCGKKISHETSFHELSSLGIVHIIVVSGAHLALLFQLLNLLGCQKFHRTLIFFLLFLFVLCCQIQAPVLRAWLFLMIKHTTSQVKLFNSTPFSILLSVTLCLSSSPQSFYQLSLPMSWLACLAIDKGRNTFTQSMLCYLFILPLLMSFQILHPWTIAINTILTPLLCLILFPLSLFSFIIHPLSIPLDWLWQSLFIFSKKISPLLSIDKTIPQQPNLFLYWLYPLLLNLFFIYKNERIKCFLKK